MPNAFTCSLMTRSLLLFSLTLLLVQVDCTNPKKLTQSVCDAWASSDKSALDKAVDRFARSLDPKKTMNENARALADWLEKQPCIRQVGIPTDVVATEPPGLDLTVVHRDGSKRTFSVLFGKTTIKLSNSY